MPGSPPPHTSATYGYAATVEEFVTAAPKDVKTALHAFIQRAGADQDESWRLSIEHLQTALRTLLPSMATIKDATLVLEYKLPLESRRIDAVLLCGGQIVVMEFKQLGVPTQAGRDQVRAYVRDLGNYHRECAPPRPIHALLVAGAGSNSLTKNGIHELGATALADTLRGICSKPVGAPLDASAFLDEAAYRPLPTLVQAARQLFESKTVREIHRAKATTDPAVAAAVEIAKGAASAKNRHLVLVGGIPGSGKTLVGLRLVHSVALDELAVARNGAKPTAAGIFLSGNGPLVQVLQHLLKSAGGDGKTFVRGVKDYVKSHSGAKGRVPNEHVLVFDEAQRAWDKTRVGEKHDEKLWGASAAKSEPELFVEFAERVPEWSVVVGLIGNGQEINVGEEGGLKQWRRAIEESPQMSSWTVHGPPDFASEFGKEVAFKGDKRLSLNTGVRFHLVPHVEDFVAAVLSENDPKHAAEEAERLKKEGVALLITRDLDTAKEYARERYAQDPDARFGLVASARDRDLKAEGVDNDWNSTKTMKIGPFYADGEDSKHSCRRLEAVATEFAAQGLELDLAVVCWGTDFLWEEGAWSIERMKRYQGKGPEKPKQLRENAYRVLMTRGRDGMVVFVPEIEGMQETFERLVACGVEVVDAGAEAIAGVATPAHV